MLRSWHIVTKYYYVQLHTYILFESDVTSVRKSTDTMHNAAQIKHGTIKTLKQ